MKEIQENSRHPDETTTGKLWIIVTTFFVLLICVWIWFIITARKNEPIEVPIQQTDH